jgi:hypothetical protein
MYPATTRRALLVAPALCLALLGTATAQAACPDPAAWTSAALEAATPAAPELELGLAGDLLIQSLMGQVCSADVTRWLNATCAPFQAGGLRELRGRLVRDLVQLSERELANSGLTPADPRYAGLAGAALTVRAALEPWDIDKLAQQLSQLSQPGQEGPDACRLQLALPEAVAGQPELVAVAILLSRAGAGRQQLLDAAAALGSIAADAPSSLQSAAADALVEAVARARLARQALLVQAGSARAQATLELARAYGASFASALAMVRNSRVNDWQGSLLMLEALTRADLEAALRTLPADVVPAAALTAFTQAVELLQHPPTPKRVADVADNAAQELVHQAWPWTRPFLLDASATIPSLATDDVHFSGSVLLGYNAANWGVVGSGELAFYDFQTAQVLSDSFREGGSLDGWVTFRAGKPLRVELRASAEGTLYDTETVNLQGVQGDALSQETSLMWRGSLLAAARLVPNKRIAAGLWLGLGAQYELYDPLHVTENGVTSEQNDSTSVLFSSRLRFQAMLIDRILALRVRSDLRYYSITRDALALGVVGGEVALAQTSVASHQLEVANRLFLDLEAARILDLFLPGVTAGFDFVSLRPPTGPSRSTVVPMLGLGVRSESF